MTPISVPAASELAFGMAGMAGGRPAPWWLPYLCGALAIMFFTHKVTGFWTFSWLFIGPMVAIWAGLGLQVAIRRNQQP